MNKSVVLCPFFEESSLTGKRTKKGFNFIECESPCVRMDKILCSKDDTYKLHSVFKTENKAKEHAKKFCCSYDFKECRTYKMIIAYKYNDI